jgi:hypothetical protein
MKAKRKSAKQRTSKRSPKGRAARKAVKKAVRAVAKTKPAIRKAAPKKTVRKVAKKAARAVAKRKPAVRKVAAKPVRKAAKKAVRTVAKTKPTVRKVVAKPVRKAAARRPAPPPAPKHPLGFLQLHVSFNTRAFEGLASFFRDTVGLPAQVMTEMGYANIDVCEGASLGFMAWHPETADGGGSGSFVAAEAGIYVMCKDVAFVYQTLTSRGITFEGPPADQPWGHRTIRTTDPEGRSLAFAQAIRS